MRFSENDGTCLFFENYFVLQEITNVSGATPTVAVASGPTADSGEWVVTLDVAFSGAGEAVVNYQLKLSDQAGDCNGSSQHSRLSPGDGVSQTGQLLAADRAVGGMRLDARDLRRLGGAEGHRGEEEGEIGVGERSKMRHVFLRVY